MGAYTAHHPEQRVTWREAVYVLLTEVLVVFLAGYGLVMIVYQLFTHFSKKNAVHYWPPAAIVIVEEAEGWIEWFVRKLSLHGFIQGKDAGDLFIVDVSASPETYQIVSRLQPTHPFVTYVASSDARGVSDVLALLNSTRRSQALVASMKDERDIHQFIKAWEQLL